VVEMTSIMQSLVVNEPKMNQNLADAGDRPMSHDLMVMHQLNGMSYTEAAATVAAYIKEKK
jgi:adenylosuccinate lyase